MDMPTNKIIVSNENGHRELEGQELENFLIEQAKLKAEVDKLEAEAQAKATQRQALLARLGLTEEEARILLGGN
jgi:hypothetical protein